MRNLRRHFYSLSGAEPTLADLESEHCLRFHTLGASIANRSWTRVGNWSNWCVCVKPAPLLSNPVIDLPRSVPQFPHLENGPYDNTKGWRRYGEIRIPIRCWWECKMETARRTVWLFLKKLNTKPSNSTPRYLPKK